MISRFTATLAAGATLAVMAIGGMPEAKAGQTLRYATWDPPTHEVRTLGISRWIKSVDKATEGRVKIRMLTKGLGAPPAYHDFIKDGAIIPRDHENARSGYRSCLKRPHLLGSS